MRIREWLAACHSCRDILEMIMIRGYPGSTRLPGVQKVRKVSTAALGWHGFREVHEGMSSCLTGE